MNLVKTVVAYLNPGQSPVLTADQPLYALAKLIQWNFPEIHPEDSFIVVFGGLHIEMNILKVLGDWMKGSEWDELLVQADVTTTGRADAILKGSHVTRSRYAHQVTASVLHILRHQAYD